LIAQAIGLRNATALNSSLDAELRLHFASCDQLFRAYRLIVYRALTDHDAPLTATPAADLDGARPSRNAGDQRHLICGWNQLRERALGRYCAGGRMIAGWSAIQGQ